MGGGDDGYALRTAVSRTFTNCRNEDPDLIQAWDREARGIPIGRPAEVNLRNNHAQYIFTW